MHFSSRFFAPFLALLLILAVSTATPLAAQTFTNSPNVPILDNSACEDTIAVAGAPTNIYGMRVTINLTHTFMDDVQIWLVPPGATWNAPQTPLNAPAEAILLFNRHGASGDNLVNTRYTKSDDPVFGPAVTISGSAPFTGVWIPSEAAKFEALYGTDANGDWKMVIYDNATQDQGTFQNWTLDFEARPDPGIEVERTATIAHNGTDNIATVLNVGVDNDFVYTIHNLGLANDLDITDITFDVAGATNISAASASQTNFTVDPSDSDTVTFTLEPTAAGPFSIDVTIDSNALNHASFTFTITGTAGPTIQLQRPAGTNKNHNTTDNIGLQTLNQLVTLTYTVLNDGADQLTITDIVASNLQNVTVNVPNTTLDVDANDDDTFDVEVTPTASGAFSFTLTLTHNASGGTYTLTISGGTAMSGTFTINNDPAANPAPDFTDIGDAFDALEAFGVNGPVTFEIHDGGTPYTSTAAYLLEAYPGMGSANPVVFRAAAGQTPTVQGGGATSSLTNCGILLRGCQYVTIEGLTFDGNNFAANYGVGISAASGVDSSNNTIRRCFITKTQSSGIAVYSTTSAENNLNDTRIENNVIFDCRGTAVGFPWGALFLGRARGATVIFNTIIYIHTTHYGVSIELGTSGHEVAVFSNNIIYANSGGAALYLENPPPTEANNNLWFMAGAVPFGTNNASTFAAWQSSGKDANGMVADPQMRDPLNGDFELLGVSPARNAASNAFNVFEDFFGNIRPIGPNPDIGAHEFNPANAPVEVSVAYGQLNVEVNDTVNVGNLGEGVPMNFTFTIKNDGGGTLTVSNLQFDNLDNCNVSVATAPSGSVAAASSTTFVLTVTAQGTGPVSFDVSFDNNDADENPFEFSVEGMGVTPAPVIEVQRPAGTLVAHNSTVNVGSIPVNVATAFEFTIYNSGSAALNLTGTPLVATTVNSGNVTASATQQPSSPVNVQDSTTFTLSIDATDVGGFNITLEIASNDGATPTYTLTITGTAANVPYLDAPASLSFSAFANQTDTKSITIKNLGNETLTVRLTSIYDPNGVFSLDRTLPVNVGLGGELTLAPAGDPDDTATLQFIFAPSTTVGSPFSGTLTLTSDSGQTPGTMTTITTVSFTGTANTPQQEVTKKKGCGISPDDTGSPLTLALLLALLLIAIRRRLTP